MSSQDIRLTATAASLGINTFSANTTSPATTRTSRTRSTRYAKLGDTLELTVDEHDDAHHPFHLHGFSIQPITLTQAGLPDVHLALPRFSDNVDVPAGYTLRSGCASTTAR